MLEAKLGKWQPPAVDVTEKELATASASLAGVSCADAGSLLRSARQGLERLAAAQAGLIDLLEELPSGSTGLGATEMRMLEMIARGYSRTNRALSSSRACARRAFSGSENTAICWMGLRLVRDRPWLVLTTNCARSGERTLGRLPAYQRSRLSLTEFGKAIRRAQGRLQPAQPDRSLVGRHAPDQRSPVALESGAGEAVAQADEASMKRLILTTDASERGRLVSGGLADCVIPLCPAVRLGAVAVAGAELADTAVIALGTAKAPGFHWLDSAPAAAGRNAERGVAG